MTETERKFLIEMPPIAELLAMPNAEESEIVQTYLLSENGGSARVRARTANGKTVYTHTEKFRISTLSCKEIEREILKEEYLSLLQQADPSRTAVSKTRITFPYGNHLMEIDIFPFWKKQAFLEIELASEEESYILPKNIRIIKEVSADPRYKNRALAKCIPEED